jgi:hypothetical protein
MFYAGTLPWRWNVRTKFNLLMVVLLLFAAVTPLSSQNAPAQTSDAEHARHSVAINLLRAINTAEVGYKSRHGSYGTWEDLLASEEFGANKVIVWLAKYDPLLVDTKFSNGPDILPGWSLRLNLTASGEGYDVMLQDKTSKPCGYAAITDERGVIWQSKTIDCEI